MPSSTAHVTGAELRQAFGHFATGVTVVTARDGSGSPWGTTANAVSSVSLDPPLILVCFARESLTLAAIRDTGAFAVNVLAEGQRDLSHAFAGRGAAGDWERVTVPGHEGSPRLRGVLALLDCTVEHRLPGGDHEIVVGRVREAAAGRDVAPLVFYRGGYAALGAPIPPPEAEPVRTRLPSRHGDFTVIALEAAGDQVVALVHGDPGAHADPLVHTHAGCLLGEALGSLLCGCRSELDAKLAAVRERGAGVVLYAKATAACGARREVDPAAAARLLREAGVPA
jgi:flavin reductase (DIM6/NTAB) family NADH-FMN oxidoreductase RutF